MKLNVVGTLGAYIAVPDLFTLLKNNVSGYIFAAVSGTGNLKAQSNITAEMMDALQRKFGNRLDVTNLKDGSIGIILPITGRDKNAAEALKSALTECLEIRGGVFIHSCTRPEDVEKIAREKI